jgi:putative endonuclease
MTKYFFVYIIANWNRTTLYVGFTGNIKQRLNQHINKVFEGFTKKYNCSDIIYYEKFDNPNEAIHREKQIKKYSRAKKNTLIEVNNSDYKSLNDSIFRIDDMYL